MAFNELLSIRIREQLWFFSEELTDKMNAVLESEYAHDGFYQAPYEKIYIYEDLIKTEEQFLYSIELDLEHPKPKL